MEKKRVIFITQFLFIAAAVVAQIEPDSFVDHHSGPNDAYEAPRFRRYVIHCTSHVADSCSGPDAVKTHPRELAQCLSNSMDACLVDHGATLYPATRSAVSEAQKARTPIAEPDSSDPPSFPFDVETLKFETVFRTCSHVGAQSCLNGTDVTSSALAACLVPAITQCVFPATGVPLTPTRD